MGKIKMNSRESVFKTKFINASKHLGVAPDQVISFKIRDIVSSYSLYHDMLRILEYETGIQSSPIKDDLQGLGHLVGQGDQNIVVVEHETGLEILYIAGSIASLIGLIPLVLKCWSTIRKNTGHSYDNHIRNVEIRRIDTEGKLIESPSLISPSWFNLPFSIMNSNFISEGHILENELFSLRNEIQSHKERLDVIEKRLKVYLKQKSKKKLKINPVKK